MRRDCVLRLLRTLRIAKRLLSDRKNRRMMKQAALPLRSLCGCQQPTACVMHGSHSRTTDIPEWDSRCGVWLPGLDEAN